MIINGILTGTGIEHPVVWYNPEEIIGLRILSIPVEDVFYGMLMLICSVSIFEFLQKDNEKKSVYSHAIFSIYFYFILEINLPLALKKLKR